MGISVKQAKNISSVLSEGLPYIQKFKGKTIVVKYGGAAMSDHSLKRNFSRDIALMSLVGMKPVIVHGGGPQIGKELKKSGLTFNYSCPIIDHNNNYPYISLPNSMKIFEKEQEEKRNYISLRTLP